MTGRRARFDPCWALVVAVLAAQPAVAQVVCTPNPYVSGPLACTNSGVANGPFDAATLTGGDASFTNSGTFYSNASASAVGPGNATAANTGRINGSFFVITDGGGNAVITNSGTIFGGLSATTSAGGNTTAINNGVIVASGGTGIASTPDGGGTATAINTGTVTNAQVGIYTYVNTAGDTIITNTGTIIATQYGISAQSNSVGNISITNTGQITSGGYGILAITSTGDVTITNSGTVRGSTAAILASLGVGNAMVVNYGAVAGAQSGILVDASNGSATIRNGGTVTGGTYGIINTIGSGGTVTTANSGSVQGGQYGIYTEASQGNATTMNTGAVNGGLYGIYNQAFRGSSFVTNTGTVSGGGAGTTAVFLSAFNGGSSTLTNSGRVVNEGGTALQFDGGPDALVLSPGSFIAGAIDLVGTGDTVRVNAGNQNLTFNTLAGATVSGSVPYVVSGNRIASIDPTGFAVADRSLMDFTRAVSGMLGGRVSDAAMGGSSGIALGFAGHEGSASRFDDAFAEVMGYASLSDNAVALSNPTATTPDGTTVWARGFYGLRTQQAEGPSLRSVTHFYGGAIGADRLVRPDLRLGGLVGDGTINTSIDLGSGSAASDIVFGGVYGRKDIGAAFFDFALLGGHSANSATRNINNNLLASGLEIATARFGGWFFTPEIAVGSRYDVASDLSLTPVARLRYLAASYDGFTETGSTSNMGAGARTVQDVEERFDVTLTHTLLAETDRSQFGLTVGVLGQQRAAPGTVNAILLGQALAFATPGKAYIAGGYVGASFDWRTASGISMFAAAEYTVMTDASNIVTGKAGLRYGF